MKPLMYFVSKEMSDVVVFVIFFSMHRFRTFF